MFKGPRWDRANEANFLLGIPNTSKSVLVSWIRENRVEMREVLNDMIEIWSENSGAESFVNGIRELMRI